MYVNTSFKWYTDCSMSTTSFLTCGPIAGLAFSVPSVATTLILQFQYQLSVTYYPEMIQLLTLILHEPLTTMHKL